MDAMSNFLGRKLLEQIEEKRTAYSQALLKGQASDYPDYRYRTGYLFALTEIEGMITGIRVDEDNRLNGAFGSVSDHPRRRPQSSDYP